MIMWILQSLYQELKRTPIPSGVVYEPAVKELEALPIRLDISSVVYGEMPIQIGYCNGHNSKLNALEYHRDSEINIAATDMILMLGLLTDVNDDYTYDTANVKAFRFRQERLLKCILQHFIMHLAA